MTEIHDIKTFVPKFYVMNPKTEQVLPNGTMLRNGMSVLIEDSNLRVNVAKEDAETWKVYRALQTNRWCRVDHVRVYVSSEGTQMVDFLGEYDDGTAFKRSYSTNYGWIVKLDSISTDQHLEMMTERTARKRMEHLHLITDLLLERDRLTVKVTERSLEDIRLQQDDKREQVMDRIRGAAVSKWRMDQMDGPEFENYCANVTQAIFDIFTGRTS